MDLEDMTGAIICIILLCVIVGIIGFFANSYHDKDIELEKYKIEMQIKHGDINIESEE